MELVSIKLNLLIYTSPSISDTPYIFLNDSNCLSVNFLDLFNSLFDMTQLL